MTYAVATFYLFVDLPDFEAMAEPLKKCCVDNSVKGTILLASEGLNATIAGEKAAVQNVVDSLCNDVRFADLFVKWSSASEMPFQRMKVRLKDEIVTMGIEGVDPTEKVGTYIKPADWNALIADPDVLLVDTRNDYEYSLGTFEGAVNPQTANFRDFPAYVEENLAEKKPKKVAMFCTGGIRCEKATSYLLEKGFEDVYHLEGGIINYLENVEPAESTWQGECYIFDDRVTVTHDLAPGNHICCRGCGMPLSPEDQKSPLYEAHVSCHHCHFTLSEDKKQSLQERRRQINLAAKRRETPSK